jgi:ribosomal subunit interface protein
MPLPLQISFRNMDPSPAVEERIRKKAAKLERFHDRIVGCKVVVEAPHRHHHKGKLYSVRVDVSVPGKDVVVDRAKPTNHAHEDVYVAVRDAFAAAVRRLEDQTRKMRGRIKTHRTAAQRRLTSSKRLTASKRV